MSDAQVIMSCGLCKKKVPFMSMSYDRKGEQLLCRDCNLRQNPVKETPKPKEGVRYVCDRCRYKFYVKVKKDKILCPYCGRDEVSPLKNYHAETLLNEL